MATLPVMGYVVGGALSTGIVASTQKQFGRKTSFQLGLAVAVASALLCCYAAYSRNFWLLWPPPLWPVTTAPTHSSTVLQRPSWPHRPTAKKRFHW